MVTNNPLRARVLEYQLSEEYINTWSGDDVFMTLWFNALSTMAPSSERMVCEMLRRYKDKIQDEALKIRITGFIRQEAQHTLSHMQCNKIFEDKGYDLEKMDKHFFTYHHRFNFSMRALAASAAVEHLLACIGDVVFSDNLLEKAEPNFKALWDVHLMEEIEHRSLAFDVHQYFKGSYFNRIRGMMATYFFYPYSLFLRHIGQLYREGYLWNIKVWGRGLWRAFIYPGYFRKIGFKMLKFATFRFDPKKEVSTDILLRLEQLYADKILSRN